ncbi:MAG: formate C-acetyltransferase [Alphaproteobacteria bacterium]|nr:formate C-acetyltransferase [Alphaproteobacteria bacterium]MCB9985973.1 formate C-acetyltransferase [Micavibrio sp.]HRK96872.1 formate C-acetyltransferase [Alphaproteobacteria bacterium]
MTTSPAGKKEICSGLGDDNNQWGKDNSTEQAWRGYSAGNWQREVDVRDFIQRNYTPYLGDDRFLSGVSAKTQALWNTLIPLLKAERDKGGVLDADTSVVTSLTAHDAGYINTQLEEIVGLQTDKPLKRAIFPAGGVKMVEDGLKAYGFSLSPEVREIYTQHRKSHNQGVFDAYTPEMRAVRKSGIITGLPDAYGRGRIIGDYRRVALYGVNVLIRDKDRQMASLDSLPMDESVIRQREELSEQIRALTDLKTMAERYGYDISGPALNAREAVQWTYFAYLGAVKEQNGAAMSFGRTSTFLDVYFDRDIKEGTLTEDEAQSLIDQLVIKLRIVRFLRTPEYDSLFSGDPTWVTESIAGVGLDGRPLVTKTSFRFLQTLNNLGAAPEPNLTVLWSQNLPQGFKDFCSKTSIATSSVQYENDDMMRSYWGDDYGIACCVSAMRIGKQMQFFGARANLAKTLLYAINGGRDEVSGDQIGPLLPAMSSDVLDYDEVMQRFLPMMDWLAKTYVNALNVIHYMHDKYAYERLEMALHDRDILRTMACGIAGLSVVADSLAAIKYGKVTAIRDEKGLAKDFQIEGNVPHFGNNDDRVDSIAVWLVETFMNSLRKNPTYRDSVLTQSVLTITSNVVYGKKTGSTPDGRKAGEPFAPGANPMHGRDEKGAVASMASVAKLPYASAQDGISYTFSIVPEALGRTEKDRVTNMSHLMDGYFGANDHTEGAHHVNVNVFNRETLLDAMDHPENYPQLTIRVSGYAVNFIRLTREQQMDVVNRTFHANV